MIDARTKKSQEYFKVLKAINKLCIVCRTEWREVGAQSYFDDCQDSLCPAYPYRGIIEDPGLKK